MEKNYLSGMKPVLEILNESPDQIVSVHLKNNLNSKDSRKIEALCKTHRIEIKHVDEAQMNSLCQDERHRRISHQGVVAQINMANMLPAKELLTSSKNAPLPIVIALDQIKDPGNLGTLGRTAYALGAGGLILPRHNSAPLGAGALRSSAGALKSLPFAIVTNLARTLDDAEELGYMIYGADASPHAVSAYEVEWQFPAIIVLGNEQKGIRPGVLKRCQEIVRIPFPREFDSLNIAQAGAILLGLASQRNFLRKRTGRNDSD